MRLMEKLVKAISVLELEERKVRSCIVTSKIIACNGTKVENKSLIPVSLCCKKRICIVKRRSALSLFAAVCSPSASVNYSTSPSHCT